MSSLSLKFLMKALSLVPEKQNQKMTAGTICTGVAPCPALQCGPETFNQHFFQLGVTCLTQRHDSAGVPMKDFPAATQLLSMLNANLFADPGYAARKCSW